MLGLRIALSVAKGVIDEIGGLLSKLARRSTYSENLADSRAVISDIDSYDLLDKATILLTPTATSNARVHSVKTYTGDETLADPNFALTGTQAENTIGTYWQTQDGWSISSNTATRASGETANSGLFDLESGIEVIAGATYLVQFDYNVTSGSFTNFIGGTSIETINTSSGDSGVGRVSKIVKAVNGAGLKIYGLSSATGTISNLSVVDVSSDFDFDRASSATRINSSGLVQDMQSITDPELVLNGDFEELGDELVTNGDFSTSGNVTTDSFSLGWKISDSDNLGVSIVNNQLLLSRPVGENSDYGRAYATNGVNSINVKPSDHAGKTFKLEFEIVAKTGTPTLRWYNNGYITFSDTTLGKKTIYFTSSTNRLVVFLQEHEGSSITLDNVSVKQVDPNDRWTLDADWSIEDGQAKFGGSTAGYLSQLGTLEVGKTYKIKADVSQGRAVLISAFYDIHDSDEISSEGNIFTVTSGTDLKIYSHPSNGTTVIDNISVKDITFSTDVDLARINYDSNGENGHILLEPTSTNLITYSEDFRSQTSFWNANTDILTPVKSTTIAAPDGSYNAWHITKDGTNSKVASSVGSTSTEYTKSIWARTISGTGTAYFGEGHFSGDGVLTTVTTEWQRIEITVTEENFYAVDFRGSSTLTEVLIWGAQMEQLPYATSYIPTLTGSTVTRAVETLTGSGNSTLINSTEGVLYAEIAFSTDGRIAIKNSDSSDDQVVIGFSSTIFCRIREDGANVVTKFDSSANQLNTYYKIAIKYNSGNSAMWVNGNETDFTDTFTLNNLNEVLFISEGSRAYGKLKALAVFNEALTDDELELLTGVTNYGSFNELASANGYTII